MKNKLVVFLIAAVALMVLPLVAQSAGNFWVRMLDFALLYVLLALGLNIVVGYAGLLDLGYVAFYAVGAYMFGLMASPHLADTFPAIKAMFPHGLHTPIWLVIPVGAALAGLAGMLLGAPTLKLRGDYLAIVTLGFGEIIRVFMNNLDRPVNITNGPKGLAQIDSLKIFGIDMGRPSELFGFELSGVTKYYYLFLLLVVVSVLICYRLERSRIGRAWMAIREDEIAAKAMGINTRNLKLLAFGMGATFGGVSGVMFASFQGFVSLVLLAAGERDDRGHGGAGRHRPHPRRGAGRGAAGRAARGIALGGRRAGPAARHRRPHRRGHPAPGHDRAGDDRHHADPPARPVAVARARQGRPGTGAGQALIGGTRA